MLPCVFASAKIAADSSSVSLSPCHAGCECTAGTADEPEGTRKCTLSLSLDAKVGFRGIGVAFGVSKTKVPLGVPVFTCTVGLASLRYPNLGALSPSVWMEAGAMGNLELRTEALEAGVMRAVVVVKNSECCELDSTKDRGILLSCADLHKHENNVDMSVVSARMHTFVAETQSQNLNLRDWYEC